jgi:hypothetical protein
VTVRVVAKKDSTDQAMADYLGVALDYGKADCGTMVDEHLVRLGYPSQLPAGGHYAAERTALRAIRRAGFKDLAAAMDAQGLERIGLASVMQGDIVAVPGEGWPYALQIALGNGRRLGFFEDGTCQVLEPLLDGRLVNTLAWRV